MKKIFPLSIIFLVALATLLYFNAPFNAQAHANTIGAFPTNNPRVTATTDTSVSIEWDAVTDADQYQVRKWVTGDTWEILTNTTGTTYTDINLNCNDPETDYGDYYKIVAFDTDTEPIGQAETGWLQGSPLNDNFDNAVDITTVPSSETLFTCNAHQFEWAPDPEVTDCDLGKGVATVWYSYTAGADGAITFDTTGADYNTFIAVWTGDYYGTFTPVACNNDNGGTSQSAVAFEVTNGETYYIEVGQYNGTGGTSATSFEFVGPPLHEQILR